MRPIHILATLASAVLSCGSPPATTLPRPKPIEVAPPAAVELPRLRIVEQALDKIEHDYVDSSRIVPRAMLLAALRRLDHDIADVAIEQVEQGVIVEVDGHKQAFELANVDSLGDVTARLRAVVAFIHDHSIGATKPATIEYAAIDGMLATLDPHSVLLDPKEASEFSTQVAGKFGGLGMVIGLHKDAATGAVSVEVTALVANDMPAAKAGIVVGDRIVSIDDRSTAAFTIDDALDHLRGAPDTEVRLVIERAGVPTPTTYVLTRAVIRISPVHSRLAGRRTGYIQIDHFSKGVADDVAVAMTQLRGQGARSWILDLRHNPGGLVNEATKLVDLFVASGTIVTTVGRTEREDVHAEASPSDDHAPLVVLVDEATASAAEVVSGALKSLDRAVIVGATTFGKASVQVMFDLDDGSKLKLTVAQYVFANDVSLQAVGVSPDIELDPVVVPSRQQSAHDVLQLHPRHVAHEADLEAHLTSSRIAPEVPPIASVTYPGPASDKDADFEVQFATELVSGAARSERAALLADATKRAQAASPRETARVTTAFSKLGIDWKVGPDKPGARLTATCTTDRPNNAIVAGNSIAITCVATNRGTAAASRVSARARSDDDTFDGVELAFGSITPGVSKRATVRIDVPADAGARSDVLVWTFGAPYDVVAEPVPVDIDIDAAPATKPVPTIQLDHVVTDSHVNLHGVATGGVQDVAIRMSNRDSKLEDRKVYYRRSQDGSASLDSELELAPGSNLISIVVRGSDNTEVTRRLSIYRSR